MTEQVTLETADAVVDVVPKLGGSLAAFDLKRGSDRIPILRPWDGKDENPRALASSPMTPWFNRISGGGINFGGRFYPISPLDPLDPFPLHGDGWSSPWEVTARDARSVTLRLRSRAIPPFDYEATQIIALNGAALDITLRLKHLGSFPLPYGLGHHPWFVRTADTRLHAPAKGYWAAQPPAFPPSLKTDPLPDAWNFSTPRTLPSGLIDNGFAGWNGRGRIEWPGRGVAVEVLADSGARFYQIYSPSIDAPFFCFEPVTHPNNAYAMPEPPAETGLRVLQPGEETTLRVTFTAARL